MNAVKTENEEYSREEMISWIKKYFGDQGYDIVPYSPDFLPARVALHGKREHENRTDEIVVELTNDKIITIDIFLPEVTINGVTILEASPIRFYQYYFINAEVYFAYPDYVKEDQEFKSFTKLCKKLGIGLLKTSKTKIEEIVKPCSIYDQICNKLGFPTDKTKMDKETENKMDKIEYHLRNCLHYFVYYPAPVFKNRAIRGRAIEKISFDLLDKLCNVENISYNEELKKYALDYRQGKGEDDYALVQEYVTLLWEKYLGLTYPNIQSRVENILQKDKKYREHFVHQFNVFLIGAYIIDSFFPKISAKFSEDYKSKIEEVWLCAATFHDFSYGLQNFDTWLMDFFVETLRIKYSQTKETLNVLNLDAAMFREALYDNIIKIVNKLKNDLTEEQKEKLIRFFYEKAVRDRNHGVLSAISLLKLHQTEKNEVKINELGMLKAAVGICCHDPDIWEALCGCHGYRRTSRKLPTTAEKCVEDCHREVWPTKRSRINREKISINPSERNVERYKCEQWEKDLMDQRVMNKITFEENPILFLLIYCDHIQDEGRVTSSSEDISQDRSSLKDVIIEEKDGKSVICANLESKEQSVKEAEIERVAWCLKDDRFIIRIGEKTIIMNGKGG